MRQTLSSVAAWVRKQVASSHQCEKYIAVSGQDLADTSDDVNQAGQPRHVAKLCGVAAFIGLGVIVVIAFIPLLNQRLPSGCDESYPCGSSPAEAETYGCVFDTMLYGWTHSKCFDSELMDRYLDDGNWTWRDDPQHEAPITDVMVVGADSKELAKRGLWTSRPDGSGRWIYRWEFHLVHCAYAWALVERALHREDVWFYKELIGKGGLEHAEHCADRWAAAARQELDADSRYFAQTKSEDDPPFYYTCAKYQNRGRSY